MRSPKRARTQHQRHVSESSPRPITTTSGCRRQVTIGELSGEVLLIIFLHCLDVSPQFWHILVHVCQIWRRVVFTSPRTLQLRLYCKRGTPVLKTLGCWPALPIIVQYGGLPTLDPPSTKDEDNVVAALRQSDRISSISLTITNSLLAKLKYFPIEEPFSDLEELTLLSHSLMTLPSSFKWGSRLRRFHSTGITIPSLPQLLSPSLDLVDLQLHEVPSAGYVSPEAFASALSGMTRLQSLSLHFLSPASRPSHVGPSPSPGGRVVLPALTHLKFRGASEYLNNFVTRIDTPGLVYIEVRLFNQLILRPSQLGRFIDRIEMQKSHLRADIAFSRHAVSITFTRPEAHTHLTLQMSCEQLDWQLSSMAQMCDHFSPLLSRIQDLRIDTTERTGEDDVDGEQWLEIIRAFDGTEDLHVTGELAADILHALRLVDGEHTTVLLALRKLYVPELVSSMIQGPLREAVESFTTSRRFSGHPVAVEELPGQTPTRDVCPTCDKGFSTAQALTRHFKDKHQPLIRCPHCMEFAFSSGRRYLFKRHLETCHPDIFVAPLVRTSI